jgi:NAD(P)-dependent dehydrogenase (short-subunit alcohol dehydrogenase family)
VVVGDGRLADGLAHGLTEGGGRVVVVSGADGAFDGEAAVAAVLAAAVETLDGVDLLVHAWLAPSLTVPRRFVDLDETAWAAGCEHSMEVAWWVARAAAAPLAATRGAMVVVVPTLGLSGGADFSMLAATAEALRVLAKACGRQWGAKGVTVNTIAAAPHHWVAPDDADALTRSVSLSSAALGGPGDPARDLAPLVALLASREAHFLTAGTLVADGGIWMGL